MLSPPLRPASGHLSLLCGFVLAALAVPGHAQNTHQSGRACGRRMPNTPSVMPRALRSLIVPVLAAWAMVCAGTPATAAAKAAACPPQAQAPTEAQMKAAMAAAADHGLLWRISKGGHSSYLYGTIHVGKVAWAFPGPQVMTALKSTDSLALEIDPTDPALTALLTQGGHTGRGAALTPELNKRLDRQRALACVDAGLLANMHPVMRVMTLSVLAARTEGLDPAWGQEIILAGHARSAQRPIHSLETAESQLKALIPDSPRAVRALVDDTLRQLEQRHLPETMRRMADDWAQGKLEDLAGYARWCGCVSTDSERALMRRLLDDRNPHLADGIDALHQQGQRVFAAVGALHMTGDKGLPTLLGQMGYTLERLH